MGSAFATCHGLPQRRTAANDPYAVLGVAASASAAEIKAAYRALVKQHHPDAGGRPEAMLALNAAWAVLGDSARRRAHDQAQALEDRPAASAGSPAAPTRARTTAARAADLELEQWLQQVVAPIERQLGQVLGPIDSQITALAADPYDDRLMEAFCAFLEQGQTRLERVETLFRARACPASAQGFGLSLYQCLSLVNDALAELERYTMGYVDSYLHDGRQMLREARRLRAGLQHELSQLLG